MKTRMVLSCPLCNRLDRLDYPKEERYNNNFPNGEGVVRLMCMRCWIEVDVFPKRGESYDDAVDRLITKWNSIKR